MARDRRAFLFGSSAVMTAFAGCQTLSSGEQSQLDLALANYTTQEQQLRITILPEGGNGSEEPVMDDREYTVPAPESDSDAAGTVRESDIAPESRYLVRVQLRNGRFERFHTHYRPSVSSDEEIFIGIRRDDSSEYLFVDFRSV
jgi:hypothetical protein